jgi:adenylate cyclase
MGNMDQVLDWLAGGALSGPNSEDVLGQLCERLTEAGLPLWRVAVFVSTLHPDVMGRSFRWEAESGVTVSTALHSFVETEDYQKSPVVAVYKTRGAIRRRLADRDCPEDFPILRDLRAKAA